MSSQQKNMIVTALVTALVALGGLATYLYVSSADKASNTTTASGAASTTTDDVAASSTSQTTDQTKSLLGFLIEEEKLAHDIYTKMYEKWGARVFGNILQSESNHQSEVLTLLNAREVADPRKSDVGQFANSDLQALYDQLLAKGLASEQGAYEVGVAIEEKDIADIADILSKVDETETDVISTLESLRRGSENHLRAFNKQL